jgi:hypothetical protein
VNRHRYLVYADTRASINLFDAHTHAGDSPLEEWIALETIADT